MAYTPALTNLIQLLTRLPGVGEKSAARLAFFVLRGDQTFASELARAIDTVKTQTRFCSRCFALTEDDPCSTCEDARRDRTIICVVEEPADLLAIERSHGFQGIFHVLHGAISPLDGRGPEQLKIRELIERVGREPIAEVLVATNPTIEGEATAVYLSRLLKPLGIRVSRIAHGIPVGGSIEYSDQVTVGRAIEGRRDM